MKKTIIAAALILTALLGSCGDSDNKSDTSTTAPIGDTSVAAVEPEIEWFEIPAEEAYEKLEKGEITHEELMLYTEVQNDITADFNDMLELYRTGIYPDMNEYEAWEPYRTSPFPAGCEIPSGVKWEDFVIEYMGTEGMYHYKIMLGIGNDYFLLNEAAFTGVTPTGADAIIFKVQLNNVYFFYGKIKDGYGYNLGRYSPYNAVCLNERNFKEFLLGEIDKYKPGAAYELKNGMDINLTDTEITYPAIYENGEIVTFRIGIIRENGVESYTLEEVISTIVD